MKYLFKIGKVDYEGNGAHEVEIEYSLTDGKFSSSAGIWDKRKTDYLSCGQILEEVSSLFPYDDMVQRIVKVWRDYHLNDLTAGSPKQEDFIAQKGLKNQGYDEKKLDLKDAGLDPDDSFIYNDKPYSYGSAWLQTGIPQSVQYEIESWASEDPRIKIK